jgi:hypothetical protein
MPETLPRWEATRHDLLCRAASIALAFGSYIFHSHCPPTAGSRKLMAIPGLCCSKSLSRNPQPSVTNLVPFGYE